MPQWLPDFRVLALELKLDGGPPQIAYPYRTLLLAEGAQSLLLRATLGRCGGD